MRIANRGHLKRLIAKSMIEARCRYHYTDDYAWDNATNFGKTDWLSAYLKSEIKEGEQVKGIIFEDWDFKTSSGYLSLNREKEGIYTFAIHSNLVYEVRVKETKKETFEKLLNSGTVEDFTHTKTGETLKVLKLAKKLTKEQFKAFNAWLRANKKGYYSKFAKGFILIAAA